MINHSGDKLRTLSVKLLNIHKFKRNLRKIQLTLCKILQNNMMR